MDAETSPSPSIDPRALSRFLGLAVVAVAAWNAAFVVAPRFGLIASVGVAALVVLARSLTLRSPWKALLTPRRDALIVGAVAAGAMVLGTALLRRPLLHAFPAIESQVLDLYAMVGTPTWAAAYVALPLTAAAEELVFRGGLQSGMESKLGRYGAAVASTALYAAGHLASQSGALIGLAVFCGLFWAVLRARTGSLWPSLLSHVVWDLFIVVWSPLVVPHLEPSAPGVIFR